jgi:sigma-B regulation protein RsbU (phosphoserine phosphatase)
MGAFPATVKTRYAVPPRIHSCGNFVQVLMRLQRATNLIASTLDLDALLDRVVNDIADSIGDVKVGVWLRAADADEMVLHGVRGCTRYRKGDRLQIGRQGMVGHVAATGKMRYARDVQQDSHYIACEPATRSEVSIPLKSAVWSSAFFASAIPRPTPSWMINSRCFRRLPDTSQSPL